MFAGIVREETRERVEHVVDVRPAEMPQQRLVVLVDQDDALSVRRRRRDVAHQLPESHGRQFRVARRDIQPRRLGAQQVEDRLAKLGDGLGLDRPQVKVDDGPRPRPVPLRLDGESLEKFAFPLEERVQRRDHERLAEPPRTRDEELLADGKVNERQQQPRLVDVGEAPFAKLLERVDVCRRLLHAAYYSKSWREVSDTEGFAGLSRV